MTGTVDNEENEVDRPVNYFSTDFEYPLLSTNDVIKTRNIFQNWFAKYTGIQHENITPDQATIIHQRFRQLYQNAIGPLPGLVQKIYERELENGNEEARLMFEDDNSEHSGLNETENVLDYQEIMTGLKNDIAELASAPELVQPHEPGPEPEQVHAEKEMQSEAPTEDILPPSSDPETLVDKRQEKKGKKKESQGLTIQEHSNNESSASQHKPPSSASSSSTKPRPHSNSELDGSVDSAKTITRGALRHILELHVHQDNKEKEQLLEVEKSTESKRRYSQSNDESSNNSQDAMISPSKRRKIIEILDSDSDNDGDLPEKQKEAPNTIEPKDSSQKQDVESPIQIPSPSPLVSIPVEKISGTHPSNSRRSKTPVIHINRDHLGRASKSRQTSASRASPQKSVTKSPSVTPELSAETAHAESVRLIASLTPAQKRDAKRWEKAIRAKFCINPPKTRVVYLRNGEPPKSDEESSTNITLSTQKYVDYLISVSSSTEPAPKSLAYPDRSENDGDPTISNYKDFQNQPGGLVIRLDRDKMFPRDDTTARERVNKAMDKLLACRWTNRYTSQSLKRQEWLSEKAEELIEEKKKELSKIPSIGGEENKSGPIEEKQSQLVMNMDNDALSSKYSSKNWLQSKIIQQRVQYNRLFASVKKLSDQSRNEISEAPDKFEDTMNDVVFIENHIFETNKIDISQGLPSTHLRPFGIDLFKREGYRLKLRRLPEFDSFISKSLELLRDQAAAKGELLNISNLPPEQLETKMEYIKLQQLVSKSPELSRLPLIHKFPCLITNLPVGEARNRLIYECSLMATIPFSGGPLEMEPPEVPAKLVKKSKKRDRAFTDLKNIILNLTHIEVSSGSESSSLEDD